MHTANDHVWHMETLGRMCHGIVDAGLDGAMLGALETTTPDQRRAIRDNLSKALL